MKKILYCSPAMLLMAKSIVRLSNGRIQLGKICWRKFSDGWPNIAILDKGLIDGADVIFLASFTEPADVFEQLSMIYALPRFGANSLKVILPDFPTGTMERLDTDEDGEEEGKIATAKTLARMLSDIPLCAGSGPAKLYIYDIHALQEKFYFGDKVIPEMRSAMTLLRDKLTSDMAIAYPDEGADKRFHRMFKNYNEIFCSKKRKGNERIVRVESGEPKGRHVVIIDDRALTCGTLLKAANEMFRLGAVEVSAFLVHPVFPEESWRKLIDAGFSTVYISDSYPEMAARLSGVKPFQIISLAGSICQLILKGDQNENKS